MLDPSTKQSIERREQIHEVTKQRLRQDIARSSVESDGSIEMCNSEARLGRPLHSFEVQKRLKGMNKNLHFEVALADPKKSGIYIVENHPVEGIRKRFICGMESGYMPEFSVIHVREKRIPNPDNPGDWVTVKEPYGETRGWRTVLYRLLVEGVITQPRIDKAFNPAIGQSSERWQKAIG